MINIYRYSVSKFRSNYQWHLFKRSQVVVSDLLAVEKNPNIRKLISNLFVEADPDFEYDGIFVFLNEPTPTDWRYDMNPFLRRKPKNYLLSQIPKDKICYVDDGIVFRKENRMTFEEAFNKGYHKVYIPHSQLRYIKELKHRSKYNISNNDIFK